MAGGGGQGCCTLSRVQLAAEEIPSTSRSYTDWWRVERIGASHKRMR